MLLLPATATTYVALVVLAVALTLVLSTHLWWPLLARRAVPSDKPMGVINALVGGFIALVALEGWGLKIIGASVVTAICVIQLRQVTAIEFRRDQERRDGFRRRLVTLINQLDWLAQNIYRDDALNQVNMRAAVGDKDDDRIRALEVEKDAIERKKLRALKKFKRRHGPEIWLLLEEMERQYDDIDGSDVIKFLEPHPWDVRDFAVIPKIMNALPNMLEQLDNARR